MAGRELKITYGTFIVGGTGLPARQITGIHKLSKNFVDGTFEADVVIRKSTASAFVNECDAMEDGFRDPHQRLLVELGSETLLDINPTAGATGNTGFNVKPEIVKIADENFDSGRSRKYTIRFSYDLPADNVAPARDATITGLRDSQIDLQFDASNRRTLTISGVFTALTTQDARDQYLNQISAYETSVCDALIGANIWERIGRPRENEDFQNKLLEFTRSYRELIFAQAGAGNKFDAANIIEQQLSITRHRFGPGDSMATARRPVEYMVTYAANVDSTKQTDLKAEWEKTIRPFVLKQIRTKLAGRALIISDEQPQFDYDNNRILVSMVVIGFPSSIIERRVTVQDVLESGAVLVPIWAGELAKYGYQGPASLRRTITETVKFVERRRDHALIDTGRHMTIFSPDKSEWADWPAPAFGATSAIHIHSEIQSTPLRWGIRPPNDTDATEITKVDIYEYYDSTSEDSFFAPIGLRVSPFFQVV